MMTLKDVFKLRTAKGQKPHDYLLVKMMSEHRLYRVNQLTEESVEAFLDGKKR